MDQFKDLGFAKLDLSRADRTGQGGNRLLSRENAGTADGNHADFPTHRGTGAWNKMFAGTIRLFAESLHPGGVRRDFKTSDVPVG